MSKNTLRQIPTSPSNKPTETNNFSNRDQQAAQPEPAEEIDDNGTPLIEGELEDSPKIISKEFSEVAVLTEFSWNAQNKRSPLQSTPEFVNKQIINDDGIYTYLDSYDELKKFIVKAKKQSPPEAHPSQNKSLDTLQPRPQLKNKILPGPLKKTDAGTATIGQFAINSNLSDYGEYLSRLYEVIGTQWNKLARHGALTPSEISSQVVIEFVLTREGGVKSLKVVDTTAGQAGTLICKDAVKSRAPFGNWTRDMVRTLGNEQLIRITFIYY